MANKIEIINYSDYYLKDVVYLLKESLLSGFSEERWFWLHEKNLLAPSFILLARCDSKIVGVYAVIKKSLKYGNKTFIAGRDIDPVVHPDYRGRGIFSLLLNEGKSKAKEIDLFFNFANSLSQPGFLKNGWKFMSFNKLIFVNIPIVRSIINFYKGLFYPSINTCDFQIKEVNSIEDFNFHEDDLEFEGDLYVCKTREYLNWRYTLNPDRKYKYFIVHKSLKNIGLLICSVDSSKMTILDILCFKDYNKVQLLKHFLLNLNHLEVNYKYIVTWSTICFNSKRTMISFKKGNYLIRANDPFLVHNIINLSFEMGPGESEFK